MNPLTPPPMSEANSIILAWLSNRINPGPIVWATGSLRSDDKYLSHRLDYAPDLEAYLAGEREHIYGSRLKDADGNTTLLCFEIDQAEHNALVGEYQAELARAGIASIYWQRQRQRGHLEIYLDRAKDPDAGCAWCVDACSRLSEIPECFPAKGRQKNPLSWPLWQRIGDDVYACTGYAVLPTDPTSRIEVSVKDRQRQAAIIRATVVDASPIDAYVEKIREQEKQARELAEREAEKRRGVTERHMAGLGSTASRRDLAKQVISDFNAAYSWKDIAGLCGGMVNGRFRAMWRHEDSASVVPDPSVGGRESAYARDYGATGTWPSKLDKYEAWCLAKGLDKRTDLNDRISALRAQLAEQERTQASHKRTEAPASQVDTQPSMAPEIQAEPTYNEMCDFIESWGAAHEHPAVEIQFDGQTVRIEAGASAWQRWLLLAVATREQRQAIYWHLVGLE